MENQYKLPLLLYDANCTLCTRFKNALQNLPNGDEISYISLHEPQIYKTFPNLSFEECNDVVHLITENNEILKGPQVIEYLVRFFPGIKKLAWMVESNAGKKAVELFYNVVNNYRKSNLSSCDNCNKPRRK